MDIARLTAPSRREGSSRGERKRGNDTARSEVEKRQKSVSKPLLLFTRVVKYWAATPFEGECI